MVYTGPEKNHTSQPYNTFKNAANSYAGVIVWWKLLIFRLMPAADTNNRFEMIITNSVDIFGSHAIVWILAPAVRILMGFSHIVRGPQFYVGLPLNAMLIRKLLRSPDAQNRGKGTSSPKCCPRSPSWTSAKSAASNYVFQTKIAFNSDCIPRCDAYNAPSALTILDNLF